MTFILGAAPSMVPVAVQGSEFRVQPGITLSEEYNDNVLLTTENRYYDYLTRVAPSLSLVYQAPNWDWNAAYAYNYRYYAKETIVNDSNHTLGLTNTNRIIPDFLFLDVSDQYTRVSLDLTRDYTQESNFMNQSDRNIFSVHPYVVLSLSSRTTVTTGYIYMDTWYKDPAAVNRKDHIGAVEVKNDLSPRSAITAGARRTWDENEIEGYTQDELSLGMFHEYQEGATITARAGNSWFDYETTDRTSQVFWEGVLTQRWPTITVSYETGLRFIPDPAGGLRREDRYLATIGKVVERVSLTVSGGMKEYRDPVYKHLEQTNYMVNGSAVHAVTTKSKVILDLAVIRLQDHRSGVSSDRYLAGARFEQLAMEELTLALDYRFANVYSPEVYLQNYYNNRFTVELRKVF